MSAHPPARVVTGEPWLGYVHAYTDHGWVAYAGAVLEVAHRYPRDDRGAQATSVVRVVIGPEVRRWLAAALLAEPLAPPLAPLDGSAP